MLNYDLIEAGDISKACLAGDKHHVGLVQILEMKKKVRQLLDKDSHCV